MTRYRIEDTNHAEVGSASSPGKAIDIAIARLSANPIDGTELVIVDETYAQTIKVEMSIHFGMPRLWIEGGAEVPR